MLSYKSLNHINDKDNLTLRVLKLAKDLGLTFQSWKWYKTFEWKKGYNTIKESLTKEEYKKAIPSLRNNQIMYLDQIIEKETPKDPKIKEWRLIQLMQNTSKGPIPEWFSKLQNTLTQNKIIKISKNMVSNKWEPS